MANRDQELSKEEVQSTKLNKMPVPGETDTEFSAEEAAEAFEGNSEQRGLYGQNNQQS